jgi:hypothetical protein
MHCNTASAAVTTSAASSASESGILSTDSSPLVVVRDSTIPSVYYCNICACTPAPRWKRIPPRAQLQRAAGVAVECWTCCSPPSQFQNSPARDHPLHPLRPPRVRCVRALGHRRCCSRMCPPRSCCAASLLHTRIPITSASGGPAAVFPACSASGLPLEPASRSRAALSRACI